jgi:hypothetical protein
VLGALGADAVLSRPTELDLRVGRLRQLPSVSPEIAAWPSVAVESVKGVLLTRAEVDGKPMRLLVDTGTDTLLLLADAPATGTTVPTHDAFGHAMQLVWGSAHLAWGPRKGRVPTWFTRSHPAFERHAQEVGGADGILGLAAMGNRRLVFDAPHDRLYLEPQPD